MYSTYLYIVANEGVDTADTYQYQGRVRYLSILMETNVIVKCISFVCDYSKTPAASVGKIQEHRCQGLSS